MTRKWIGAYEMGSALFLLGVLIVATLPNLAVAQTPTEAGVHADYLALRHFLPIAIVLIQICVLSVGGLLLWMGYPTGRWLSALAQALQIVRLQAGVWSYSIMSGVAVVIGYRTDDGLSFGFHAGAAFQFDTDPKMPLWGVDLVSLVLFAVLLRGTRRPATAAVLMPPQPQ